MLIPNKNLKPDFSRFLKMLRRDGELDRVPFYEFGIDRNAKAVIMGKPMATIEDLIEFQSCMGYDYVKSGVKGCLIEMKGTKTAGEKEPGLNGKREYWVADMGCIKTWADYEKFKWPDPKNYDYSAIERTSKLLPDGMKIIVTFGHVLEDVTGIMGYETLVYALYDDPDLVEAIFERVAERYISGYETCAQMDCIGALEISDDLGFKTSTMLSPDTLRKYVFPWYKRYCDICHAYNKPLIMHSCGNLQSIMEDLLDCGIDAKHSYEDQILPVTQMKEQYGKKVAVLGGIDVDLLSRGTEDEIRKRVREVLEVCMPGGGYALGSGNTITNYVPVSNYLAMIDEGLRYK